MIYLDHAASTPVRKEVRKVMAEVNRYFANPGSTHPAGKKAKELLEHSRTNIKHTLNAKEHDKIIFTSGGTESINLALKGVAFARRKDEKKNHLITSKIEHKTILETCKYLEQEGYSITYLDVDKYGRVNPKEVEGAITRKTILISIMYANNEVGTIQPIKEIAAIARKKKVLFHTDACQAGMLDLDVQKLGVDLLTLNSNKMYGPKGAGLLYVKEGILLQPLIHGGGQEYGLRSGTENVSAIAGFTKTLELAQKEKQPENKRLLELSSYFSSQILKKIPNISFNGHHTEKLPNNVNVSFKDVEAETILSYLNQKDIYASAGSACTSNKFKVSHVLKAMNVPEQLARGSIRFTFGKYTSKKDIDKAVKALVQIVGSLRKVNN